MKRQEFLLVIGAFFIGDLIVCSPARSTPQLPTIDFLNKQFILQEVRDQDGAFIFNSSDPNDTADTFIVFIYPSVTNYSQLQDKKTEILRTFQQPGGVVFTNKDAPPSSDFSGEALIVAGQGYSKSTDLFFSRLVLSAGVGFNLMYGRAFTEQPGSDSADAAGAWMNTHGSDVANALIAFSIRLSPDILSQWKQSLQGADGATSDK